MSSKLHLERVRKVFPAIMVTLVTTLILAACSGNNPTPTATLVPTSTSTPSPTATLAPTPTPTPMSKTISEIIRSLTPSIVHIQTESVRLDQFNQPAPGGGVGTGQIIDEDGHVLTNNHVIEGAQRILVPLSDGRAFEAELTGGDATLDLAVLRIDADSLVPIPIGELSKLQVGDMVVAVGHALNLPGGPTITGGWVSALERAIDTSQTVTMQHLIQTDAAINPGNSGGPLLNDSGELVGINTAKLPAGEGIGFAIAIDTAMPVIKELIAEGRIDRGFFGVSGINITAALAMNFDLPVTSGVGIASVTPGSPADQAGLQVMDIIVNLANRAVSNVAELDAVLIGYRSGTSVGVEFFRGEQNRKITVTLGETPS